MEKSGTRKVLKASKSRMDGELLALHWMDHKNIFSQAIKGLRGKDAFTDATLACEGQFYPVHKFVLSTCSEYFSNIFEWTPCVNPVIVINNIIAAELEILLDFMYNGEVNVKEEMISGILHAANCMKIRGLSVIEDEGQRTQLAAKNKTPFSGPPKKKQKQDVKRKVPGTSNSRSTVNTFREPPPPRPLPRTSNPARLTASAHSSNTGRLATTARSAANARPLAVSRPSSAPNPVSPSLAPIPMQPSSCPTLVSPAHSSSTLVRPAVPVSVPTSSPSSITSRVPIHSTPTIVATSSAPLFSSGRVVSPVLNLNIPTSASQVSLGQSSQAIHLQTSSVDLHSQLSYPQIISSHTQSVNQIIQPLTVSHQIPSQFIRTSSEQGQTIHILAQDQQRLVQVTDSQISHELNNAPYEIETGAKQLLDESYESTSQAVVSVESMETDKEELYESSPSSETQMLQSSTALEVSGDFEQLNHHPSLEETSIKNEHSCPSENTVVVSVSIADDSDPPQISIPHTLTPLDTLVEAVKMEEQNIVIKTDEGAVGIPEFLDSLEMRPVYVPKEVQGARADTPQSLSSSETLYEFTESYPETSTSSMQPLTPRPQKISTSRPQSSNTGDHCETKQDVCGECNKVFKNKEGLRRHRKSHTSSTIYTCTHCSYTTSVFKELTLHKHSHAETLSCQECNFTTKISKELVDHKKTHTEPFWCILCDYTSRSAREFGEHKKSHPSPYKCSLCDHQNNRLEGLKLHLVRKHEKAGPYHCQYCNYSTLAKSFLTKHVKSVHEKKLLKDG